jgi:Cu2+-exporting ATPase
MVGVGKGAQSGVLIKRRSENMNKVNVLITDKTGTITEGKPSVEKVFATNDEDSLCKHCFFNQYSEHPLAQAVVNLRKRSFLNRSQGL